ncbi:LysR substrate-binding domain-containing protein [Novosphingobium aerophilum]|uniref:LysR family transcriptional regulator n=1 Tax=Novosphingobium aerophilum TaxID=2839843 RepID=A0A7X1FB98_9SPHN|nr:LysR substrate-binding domain-containing protein [Novosphingobium aerophilum]MBC2653803.1 LysR family transcriptional regulator [Novosphingobium aerophilum]
MVRLTTVEAVAERIVPAALVRLQARYPGITVDLMSDPRSFNLSRREADLAIRMARFEGNELVSRRLGTAHMALYASTAYVERHGGVPAGACASAEHSLVTVLGDQSHLAETRWLEDRFPRARRTVRTNNRNGMLAAVQAGLGVACLPCFMADGLSGVVRLTDPADMPPREVWLGVHEDLRHMPRIRAVIEALDEGFAAMQGRLAGLG